MKSKFLFLGLILMFINQFLYSQTSTSVFHDYILTTDEDISKDVLFDGAGNSYVVGEVARITSQHGIRLVKYNSSNTQVATRDFGIANGYYESVTKMLMGLNGNLYVVCNATSTTNGSTSILVIQLNTSLTIINSKFYTADPYNYPTDACIDGSGNIVVVCNKQTGSHYDLAVVKINSSTLAISGTPYTYAYSGVAADSYQEIGTDVMYHSYDNNIYVCGKVTDPSNGFTTHFLIRLSANLTLSWKSVGTFATGFNAYYSVYGFQGTIYASGCQSTTTVTQWVVRRYNTTANTVLATRGFPYYGAGLPQFSQGFKITFANASNVIAVGYARNTSLNTDYVYTAKMPAVLSPGGASFKSQAIPAGSSFGDAISNSSGKTFITGTKSSSIGGYMFCYGFDVLGTGNIFYRDSLYGRVSSGYRMAMTPDQSRFAVTGASDKNLGNPPLDLQYFTRFYSNIPLREAAGPLAENQEIEFNYYPNPVHDKLTVKCSENINSILITDITGKIVLQQKISETTFFKELDLSDLSEGIYLLQVNDGISRKIIKN